MSEPIPGDFTVIESRQRIIVHLKADIEVEQAEPKHTDLRRADRMIIDTGIGVLHTFCSGDGEMLERPGTTINVGLGIMQSVTGISVGPWRLSRERIRSMGIAA